MTITAIRRVAGRMAVFLASALPACANGGDVEKAPVRDASGDAEGGEPSDARRADVDTLDAPTGADDTHDIADDGDAPDVIDSTEAAHDSDAAEADAVLVDASPEAFDTTPGDAVPIDTTDTGSSDATPVDSSGPDTVSDATDSSGDAGTTDTTPGDAGSKAIVQVAAGRIHSCALRAIGEVVCWGGNAFGTLGDGTTTARLTPVPVTGLTDATQISAGDYHSCAVKKDGRVVCWGEASSGKLGDGSTSGMKTSPVAVSGLTGVVEVACGGTHTCARRATDMICWGNNANGQLGDGTTTDRPTPTLSVASLTGPVEIAAGRGDFSCARQGSGAVYCWGFNVYGMLGDGTTTSKKAPTKVFGLDDAVGIALGGYHACARRSGAEGIVCWGENGAGQLGDGSTLTRLTPVPVSGTAGLSLAHIATGNGHTCLSQTSGAMKCWGSNSYGQLGIGSTSSKAFPTDVPGMTAARFVSGGFEHTCTALASGGAACWGRNYLGQLGDGTTKDKSTWVAVGGLP